MKQFFKYIYISLVVFILLFVNTSCQSDINVTLPKPESKLVIEASIELNEFSTVFITKNHAYFEVLDSNAVNSAIIHGDLATVIVSDGIVNDTLIPHNFSKWPYKGYIGTKIKGQIRGRYSLTVKYDNNQYTSHTSLLDTIPIDSIRIEYSKPTDTTGFLYMYWKDKPEIGNYYTIRLKTQTKQTDYFRPFIGIHLLDDKRDNGKVLIYGPLTKGAERNDYYYSIYDFKDKKDMSSKVMFCVGDTVFIKLSTIDSDSYTFWSSWYRNKVTDSNPFTNPASVKTNIIGNNVNGYWIGYSNYIVRCIVKQDKTLEIDRAN